MLNIALKRARTLPLRGAKPTAAVIAASATAATACLCTFRSEKKNSGEGSGVRDGLITKSIQKSVVDRHGVLCHSVPADVIQGGVSDTCPVNAKGDGVFDHSGIAKVSVEPKTTCKSDKCPHEEGGGDINAEKIWSDDEIHNLVESRTVVLFMKGDPQNPKCRFSRKMIQLLQREEIDFLHVNVLEEPNLRARVKEIMQWPTFPQLYCHGDIVGGLDEVQNILSKKIRLRAFLGIE